GPLLTEIQAAHAARLTSPDVQLTVTVDAELPALETDRAKVAEIVGNLVDNAVKFTPSGTIAIVARPGPSPDMVGIEVSDTGAGIAPEEIDSIFDAFRQLGASSTRPTGGVGLGLSIVRQLTEALGGRIEVSSHPGAGSTFRVHLPVRVGAGSDALAA